MFVSADDKLHRREQIKTNEGEVKNHGVDRSMAKDYITKNGLRN